MTKNSSHGTREWASQLKKGSWLVIPLLLVIALALIFFNRLILSNLLLARGDPFLYFYPYWEMAAEAFRSGRLPLWNPNIFMGAPFLANSQVGLFYPLNWPVWLTLPTPYAYSASVFVHVIIGCIGAYFAGRRALKLSVPAAFLAAFLFGLGGYFTAQVEHINQLQGMSWLPWFLVAISSWSREKWDWRASAKLTVTMAGLFTLQILAGHLQAVLITAVFVFVWQLIHLIATTKRQNNGTSTNRIKVTKLLEPLIVYFGPLLAAIVLATAICAVQLIPTIELIQHSGRRGGLSPNEALSFSLHPLLISRAFLPNYDEPLFIEYVALLPITTLLLAVFGTWFGKKRLPVVSLLVIGGLGLFLALGFFNPINHLLIRIPGINFFRVPARWLLLYALAMSLLAGSGLDELIRRPWQEPHNDADKYKSALIVGILITGILIAWAFLSVQLASIIPIGAEASPLSPSGRSTFAWSVELFLAALLIVLAVKFVHLRKFIGVALIITIVVVLYTGTRNLPYGNPTTPEAYFDTRPPSLRLQASQVCENEDEDCIPVNGRFLSLSNIFFDVGDQPEIDTIYSEVLSEAAQYDNTVAIKQKEIIGPNLPMIYGLSSVDGFDGGILPLNSYNVVTSLMLPVDVTSVDGRLREYLTAIPEERWLDLFNAEFVITDKVGDVWESGVFFDLQFPKDVSEETGPIGVGHIQRFEATELWLLVEGEPGSVQIEFTDGGERELDYQFDGDDLLKVSWPRPGTPNSLKIDPCAEYANIAVACSNRWRLLALALVDSRDGTFQPLVAGAYRLVHSGDVKIYQNLDVLPRAFLVDDWIYSQSAHESLQLMNDPTFDPRQLAILQGDGLMPGGERASGDAKIISYEPEKIVISAENEIDSILMVTDAYYPGWKATIDGKPASIYEADVMFRSVLLPPGKHTVEFTFMPESFRTGQYISLAGLALWLLLALAAFWPNHKPRIPAVIPADMSSIGEQMGNDG